ncbi:hypothetical protein N7456_002333 [Penicillium angulare]|uniref:BZIP domain-containing protein n=1 Tax=Penicillium angulare TaxID=116970 RepID=A0A9W9G7W3_9EURO|nr:hypothetical protein N7456_002333 [Penicillium angulare]
MDSKERKRNQNRIAQRRYRQNQKQRLRVLEEAMNLGVFKNAELDRGRNPSPDEDPFWSLPVTDAGQASTSIAPALDLDLLASPRECSEKEEPMSVLPDLNINPCLTTTTDLDAVAGASPGRTSLHRAVCAGNELLTRLLLERGADAKRHDSQGLTALHLAVEGGHESLVRILLLEHKLDPNVKDFLGRTALFQAVQCNNDVMAKLLLDGKVDVNCRNIYGDVALHMAVEKGSEQLTKILLSYGAEVDA